MYEGLHHVSLVVTDLAKSKHFYGEILGLQESGKRPDFSFEGAWYELGPTQIHLIVHDEAKTLRQTKRIDTQDGHFAIRVNGSMEELAERLKSHGVDLIDRPQSLTGWHQIFITDPDGNIIEFNR